MDGQTSEVRQEAAQQAACRSNRNDQRDSLQKRGAVAHLAALGLLCLLLGRALRQLGVGHLHSGGRCRVGEERDKNRAPGIAWQGAASHSAQPQNSVEAGSCACVWLAYNNLPAVACRPGPTPHATASAARTTAAIFAL